LDLLPVVVGTGWTSGLSAYGTVVVIGLLGRFDMAPVPEVLTRGDVLIAAGAMFVIEFVADKIPYVDNAWDAVHTVVRPAIAALLGVAFANEVGTVGEALAATGTGLTALISHAVKAGVRLAVNTSPEPLSTIAVSSAEDLAMAGVSFLVVEHPWIAFSIAAVLLIAGVALLLAIRRRIQRFLRRVRSRRAGTIER
jgi:uncharacterized protein DUF4126